MRYSEAYVTHLEAGPFPGQIDPWAEAAHYFHQIHAGMIGAMLEDLRIPLLQRGYIAGREASLFVTGGSEPDIYVLNDNTPSPASAGQWDYAAAAEAIRIAPGVAVQSEPFELDAIRIKEAETSRLVTIVEVISPGNKVKPDEMLYYEARRQELVYGQGVNVVEIDLTRSRKRLIPTVYASLSPYHIAVHLAKNSARFLGAEYGEAVSSFALPLQEDILPVHTQKMYDIAYRQSSIAALIATAKHYTSDNLPFPSLLTQMQKDEALQTATNWLKKLDELSKE